MKVKALETVGSIKRADGVVMSDFFGKAEGNRVSMGHAVFPPGTVVPWASHSGDEYSYILEGCVKCESNQEICEMSEGMAGFIPSGQEHRSFNDSDEDCKLLWMLVEKE
ncbi:MAG: cupin domain-containing protein [Lachnospiraceae bacterium]